MQMFNRSLLFEQVSTELRLKIESTKQQSSCTFLSQIPHQNCAQSLQEPKYSNKRAVLQLRGQFLIELDEQTLQIISALQCDYQRRFQVLRTSTIANEAVGDIIGIIITDNRNPFQRLQLFLDEPQKSRGKANNFLEIFQKKYIVQTGFHKLYRAIRKIGRGVTATVFSVIRLTDNHKFAIKSFKKDVYFKTENGKGKAAFLKEFKFMTQLSNRYLCQLSGVFESQNSTYIVMQLLSRSLYNYIQRFGFPPIKLCKEIMVKLLIGLSYMHEKGIMHRDLKLENVMVRGDDSENIEPVIVDFGLAEYVASQQFLYLRCGTPGYVAPQVINISSSVSAGDRYGLECDIFSMGVIFHILILGKPVFEGDNIKDVIHNNKKCQINYQFPHGSDIPAEARELLRGMLQKDPKQRLSAMEALHHPFFNDVKVFNINQAETKKSQLDRLSFDC